MAETNPVDLPDHGPRIPGADADEVPASAARIAGAVRWALVALLAFTAAATWMHGAFEPAPAVARDARYRCPMHASFLRESPGQCGICGMDLVAAAAPSRPEGEPVAAPAPGLVPLTLAKERTQRIGVRTEKVTRQRLTGRLRATGFVSVDDSSVYVVTTRFSGWAETLAAQVGQSVKKGQILATFSGPELLSAQQVYLAGRSWAAKQRAAAGAPEDENNSLQRLGIDPRDAEAVALRQRPLKTMPLRAPISGYLAKRSVSPGLYVQPGSELFQIVDLSRVWVIADVHERDIARLKPGQRAQFFASSAGEPLAGRVDFVYPALDPESRTLRARMHLPNQDLQLRPGMSGELVIDVPAADALTVPAEAVIDTGELQYVFVARTGGRFEPRTIRAGAAAEGRIPVLEGLDEGELVVTTANFLIDSESRMRAAAKAFDPDGERAPGPVRSASRP